MTFDWNLSIDWSVDVDSCQWIESLILKLNVIKMKWNGTRRSQSERSESMERIRWKPMKIETSLFCCCCCCWCCCFTFWRERKGRRGNNNISKKNIKWSKKPQWWMWRKWLVDANSSQPMGKRRKLAIQNRRNWPEIDSILNACCRCCGNYWNWFHF